jgi:hypothetical protein
MPTRQPKFFSASRIVVTMRLTPVRVHQVDDPASDRDGEPGQIVSLSIGGQTALDQIRPFQREVDDTARFF